MVDVSLISINYQPEPTGIAPYVTGLAAGLRARGLTVQVTTGYPHYPAWRRDPEFSGFSSCAVEDDSDDHRVRHYIPKNPNTPKRLLMEATFAIRALGHRHTAGKDATVICTSPTLISAFAAVLRKKITRRNGAVIVWVQDFYGLGAAETGQVGGSSLVRLVEVLEGWTLRNADAVVAIHSSFKSHIVTHFGLPDDSVTIIKNWTHIDVSTEGSPSADATGTFGDWPFVVLHAGNKGRKQGLENVLETAELAAQRESTKDILFVLLGDGNQRPLLERRAEGMRNVKFVDPLGDKEFSNAIMSADILLVNESGSVKGMAVPSKLTSYFAAGRPVVASAHPESGSAHELAAAGAGIRVDPERPEELLDAVSQLRMDADRAQMFGQKGVRYVESALTESAAIGKFFDLCVAHQQNASPAGHRSRVSS